MLGRLTASLHLLLDHGDSLFLRDALGDQFLDHGFHLHAHIASSDLLLLRLSHLLQRKDELLAAINELQASIEQLDTINQEILNHDPLAVPEPIPALALHELSRLEQELQHVLADPALRLNTSRENI